MLRTHCLSQAQHLDFCRTQKGAGACLGRGQTKIWVARKWPLPWRLPTNRGSVQQQAERPGAPNNVETSAGTFLGSGAEFIVSTSSQAAAYNFLSISSALLGILVIAFPEAMVQLLLHPEPTASEIIFARVLGATMSISAATEYSLKEAVSSGRVTAGERRLMATAAFKSFAYLLVLLASPSVWNPLLFVLFTLMPLAGASINLIAYRNSVEVPAEEGMASPTLGAQAGGWAYTVFALLYLATVAACFAPEAIFTLPLGPGAEFLKRCWAPGFLLAAVACYNLREGALQGRLAAVGPRSLNLGLAGLEAAYSALLASAVLAGAAGTDAGVTSNLGGSLVISAFCLIAYLTSSKKP